MSAFFPPSEQGSQESGLHETYFLEVLLEMKRRSNEKAGRVKNKEKNKIMN